MRTIYNSIGSLHVVTILVYFIYMCWTIPFYLDDEIWCYILNWISRKRYVMKTPASVRIISLVMVIIPSTDRPMDGPWSLATSRLTCARSCIVAPSKLTSIINEDRPWAWNSEYFEINIFISNDMLSTSLLKIPT